SASGRLSVIVATPSRRSRIRDSKFIGRSSVFMGSSRTAGLDHRLASPAAAARTAAPRRPAPRTTAFTDSPRLRLRLARPRSGPPYAASRQLRGHVQALLDLERFHQDEVHAVRATLLRRELHAEARHDD